MSVAGPDARGSGHRGEVAAGAVSRVGGERLLLAVALIAAAAGAALLWTLADRMAGLPALCPVRTVAGLYCPGCGSTRATAALLHGDVEGALGYNPLAVLFAPFLMYAAIKQAARMASGRPIPRRHIPAPYIWGLLGLIVAYTVLRNLPGEPFTWLAP